MRGNLGVAVFAFALSLASGLAARAQEPDASAHGKLFDLYCGSCHGLGETRTAPDLATLAQRHGAPLPTARLLDFVMDDRRLGGARICGDHALRPAPFNDAAERSTVRAVLDYLASVQRDD